MPATSARPASSSTRALAVSDLVTVHQKTGIGRLSAYCGAISAGVGAGAGICYLLGGDYDAVAHTVVNAVAILSGTICDGAKPSCAAKIAAAVDAGIMGYRMYLHHREFRHGEGIVGSNVDDTIAKVGVLAQQGMRQTDRTILDIMRDRCKLNARVPSKIVFRSVIIWTYQAGILRAQQGAEHHGA